MVANPVGYQWLKEQYDLKVLSHHERSYTGGLLGSRANTVMRHHIAEHNYYESQRPNDTFQGHLLFALKHEGVNPGYLAELFQQSEARNAVLLMLETSPTGKWTRRVWYWYETLTGEVLPVGNTRPTRYESVLDEKMYFTARAVNIRRYCLKNNLPGHGCFLPLVRKTTILTEDIDQRLLQCLSLVVSDYDDNTLARAARYLITEETRSSNEIEQENITPDKYMKFGKAIELAGRTPLTKKRLIEIHNIIKGGTQRESDYRYEQNYIGTDVSLPTPKPDDIHGLMDDWFEMASRLMDSDMPAVVKAGILSASYVYLHPFMDGNGRVSRYLIQDALAKSEILQLDFTLPVSSGILRSQKNYYRTLDLISQEISLLSDFYLEENGRLVVTNKTDHLFRYFDLTEYCSWLSEIISEVAQDMLPDEIDKLILSDKLYDGINNILDLPAGDIRKIVNQIVTNKGLGKKHRKTMVQRYPEITEQEFEQIMDVCDRLIP